MTRAPGTAKIVSEEDMVRRFFALVESKNLDALLDLFDHDAVVNEPFSSAGVLRGRFEIEPFLRIALMANTDLRREIKMEEVANSEGKVSALVTFEKGGKVEGRFTFELDPASKKIRKLKIQFL